MRNSLRIFAPVLSAAFVVGAIWSLVNRSSTVNGVGLLARQGWPLNNAYLCIAAGAAFGLLQGLSRYARMGRRAAEMAAVARQLGFQLCPEVARRIADDMPLFANWRSGENSMVGQRGGIPLEVVDFTGIIRGEEGDTVTRHTVVLLPSIGLPYFDLRPRRGKYRLFDWLGVAGVTFDPDVVEHSGHAASVKRFGKLFYLNSPSQQLSLGHARTVIPAEQESNVRRTFSPAVMEVLSQHPDLSIQSHGDRLAIWQGERHSSARARPRLIELALKVRSELLHLGVAPVEVIVPARPDTTPERQQQRFNAAVAGALLGGFVGFIIGGFGSMAVLRNAVRAGNPAQLFVEPLVFFGCGLGGVAIGAVVGSFFHLGIPTFAAPGKLADYEAKPQFLKDHQGREEREKTIPPQGSSPRAGSVRPRSSRLYWAGFLLVGGSFAALGGWSGYSSYHFADGAARSDGTVVTMESEEGAMIPVVRYRVAGKDHECKGRTGSSPPSYAIGEKVTILYRPEMPAEGRIDSFADRWIAALMFGGAGLAFAGIGLVGLLSRRRGDQAGP